MRFLVTGGAGFIGSNLVDRLLAEDGEVTILDDFNDFYDPAIKRANVEAFAKPVRVVELKGGKPRFRRFLDGMYADGFARRFEGSPLPSWTYTPPDDRVQVARAILAKLKPWTLRP